MVHWMTINADDVQDIVGRKWIVLQLGLVRPGKVKSLWFHSSVPSLNKHSSLVLRSLKTNILSGAQAKPQMQVIFRHRLSFKTWRLTFMQDMNGKVLYLKMAIKAVLATKKLGEHLRRDAQHMRVTGALERDGPAEQPKGRWLELWSSMRCWRGGGTSTWSFVSQQCVPVCQSTTKTRQPSPTKALCSNP